MKHKVVALGIDAPNGELFQQWLAEGRLPHIAAVAERGVTVRHSHLKRFRNARCWNIFLTGRDVPGAGSAFRPSDYAYFNEPILRDDEPPFYALGKGRRVCIFDLPTAISDGVDGAQVVGWGSELNASVALSQPEGLMAELILRHGADPKTETGFTVRDQQGEAVERSFRNPCLYSAEDLEHYRDFLEEAVRRRTDICLDLLAREPWDLFLAAYIEGHTANHLFWHVGQSYPVPSPFPAGSDPIAALYQSIDTGVGRIAAVLSPETTLVLFTIDDTGANKLDVPGMALLPEMLFRWSFPGRSALAGGDAMATPRTDYHGHWKHEVWALRTPDGDRLLKGPAVLEAEGDPLSWNPASWYRPLWAEMKAFALPTLADGYIRLNVAGREAAGTVSPDSFDATVAEIVAMLEQLRDPRTGEPAVDQLIRIREKPADAPELPPDLVVLWRSDRPLDALDSPQFGQVGPLPYFRSGGHRRHGSRIDNLMLACGPGIAPGSTAAPGRLEDLAATLLDLVGAESAEPIDGRPLLCGRHAAGST
jgi:hypothetical protein